MKHALVVLNLLIPLAVPAAVAAQTPQPATAPAADRPVTLVPISELRSKPRYLSGDQPSDRPELAAFAQKGVYGHVVAEATVLPDGTVTDIAMVEPAGIPAVDDVIVATLQTWKLSPPIDKAGNKVAVRAKFPFSIGSFPQQLVNGVPAYPAAAKAAFHNGSVTVGGKIDETGHLVDVVIRTSSQSPLLDTAALDTVRKYVYAPPRNLMGAPAPIPVSYAFEFSQAEGDAGSYIGGLRSYPCRTFVGEVDWWTAAHPDAKPSDWKFYTFMAGLSYIAPNALGWGNLGISEVMKRHPLAWDHALVECRKDPGGTFIEKYRKG